jgi:hypothetical protein
VNRALSAAASVAADSQPDTPPPAAQKEKEEGAHSNSSAASAFSSSSAASAEPESEPDCVLPGFIDQITKTQIIAPAIAPSTGIVLGYQTYCTVLNRTPKNTYASHFVPFQALPPLLTLMVLFCSVAPSPAAPSPAVNW